MDLFNNRYAGTCPSCSKPAYIGVVPAAVTCSNRLCRFAEFPGPPRCGDVVTVQVQFDRNPSPMTAALDGQVLRIVWLYENWVELEIKIHQGRGIATVAPDEVVELLPYLVWNTETPSRLTVPPQYRFIRPNYPFV